MSGLGGSTIPPRGVSDEQWCKTNASWKELRPRHDFNNYLSDANESAAAYHKRITEAGFDIPFEVVDQWLYWFYNHHNTVELYSWIDYRNASFDLVMLSTAIVLALKATACLGGRIEEVAANWTPEDVWRWGDKVRESWQQRGTWLIPPVVLDVDSFPTIPAGLDIRGPYQVIEGHSRVGFLHTMTRAGKPTADVHTVYMLRKK